MGNIELAIPIIVWAIVMMVVWCCVQCCETRNRFSAVTIHDQEMGLAGQNSSAGLNRGVNEALPTFECKSFDGFVKEGQECVVCLSEFEDSEIVKLLPNCCHYFHKECIEIWFLSHSFCPICRTRVHPDPSSIL
ncbi:hypothetical protein SUGI_0654210 [Cryptomeria japonica]|nr:hypothetical protein SUGI_0654210 [Cryptomeria japonica]